MSFSKRPQDNINYYGLIRRGETCYLNSVLQVLFMTKEFREAVTRSSDGNPHTEFIDHHLKALFDDLQKQPGYTYNIIKKLGINNVYKQCDAAEYFERVLTLTSTEASKIFHGLLANRITCHKCHTETDKDVPFWHLPLSLVVSCSEDYSVVNGIKEFFRPSDLCGENQMYCHKCDDKVDATLTDVIKDHPDVLILLLKRFEFNYDYMSHVKINCFVEVPYTLQIPESETYELYAVVDHFGDLRGGHYTATIKIQKEHEARWYNFDGSKVTLTTVLQKYNTEKSQTAYLLFYRKKVHAADIVSQDLRSLSTNESFLAPTNYNNDKCKDAKNKHKREGAVEGAVVKKEENTRGDYDRQSRPDDHDFTPEDSVRPAVYDNLNKQDVVKNNENTNCNPPGVDKEEKRKIDFEYNTNGMTGTDKQTRRMCCEKVGNRKQHSLKHDQRYKQGKAQSDHDILNIQEVPVAYSPDDGVARQARNVEKGRRGKGGDEKHATKRKAVMENLDDSEPVQHKDMKKFCVLAPNTAEKIGVTDTTQKDADVGKQNKGQENESDTEQIQIKNSSQRTARSKKRDRRREHKGGGSHKKETTYRTRNRGVPEARRDSKKFRTQVIDQADELRSQVKTEEGRKTPHKSNEAKNITESLVKTSQSSIKGTETFNKGNTEQKSDIIDDSMNTLLTGVENLRLNDLTLQEQPEEKNKPKKQKANKMPDFPNIELEVEKYTEKKINKCRSQ